MNLKKLLTFKIRLKWIVWAIFLIMAALYAIGLSDSDRVSDDILRNALPPSMHEKHGL